MEQLNERATTNVSGLSNGRRECITQDHQESKEDDRIDAPKWERGICEGCYRTDTFVTSVEGEGYCQKCFESRVFESDLFFGPEVKQGVTR